MLATVSNVWWPKVQREVVAIAKNCPQCSETGKNTKNVHCQKLGGKLATAQKTTKKLPSIFGAVSECTQCSELFVSIL